ELNRILLKYTEKDVPALFWTANAWAGWINLSLDSPFALADLPKVEIIMRRVLDLGEDYFYGGVHIFYGVYYGGRPVLTGGDPERAKEHFERNLEISRGKFLMTYVYYARYYAVPVQDRVLFQELLGKVIESPVNILPEQALINGVARLRAQEMLKNIDKYFFREEK
ncbi:MAG: TRAP transporter TatT component family protein, partial [Fidelibacterota bacterium]